MSIISLNQLVIDGVNTQVRQRITSDYIIYESYNASTGTWSSIYSITLDLVKVTNLITYGLLFSYMPGETSLSDMNDGILTLNLNPTNENLYTVKYSPLRIGNILTLNTAQAVTAAKTFNDGYLIYSPSGDTTIASTQKLMILDSDNKVRRINITPDSLVTTSSGNQSIAGNKTFSGNFSVSGTATLSSSVTLSGVNVDTASSSGQKLAVLNTTSNAIQRVNITPDTLVTTSSGDQTIAGNKTLSGNLLVSGPATLSSSVTLSGVNADTASSSSQKLAVLNTTSNAVQRINITPDTLVTTSSGTQSIAGNKTFSGAVALSSDVTLSGVTSDTTASSGQKLMVLNTTTNKIERVNITPNNLSSGGSSSGPRPMIGKWATVLNTSSGNFFNAPFDSSNIAFLSYDTANSFITLEADGRTFKNNTAATRQFMVIYNIYFETNSTGLRRAEILINGSNIASTQVLNSVVNEWTYLNSSAVLALAPGEYFTIRVQQTSGVSLNIGYGNGASNIQIITLG